MIDPGLVLQKIVLNTGGEKPSYLGPPESFIVKNRLLQHLGSSHVYFSGIDGTTTVDFTQTEKGIQVFTTQRISNIVHGK